MVRHHVHGVRLRHGAAHGQGRRRRQLGPRKSFSVRAKARSCNNPGRPRDFSGNCAFDDTGNVAAQFAACFSASWGPCDEADHLAIHVAAQLETRFSTAGSFAASSGTTEKTLTGSKSHSRIAHLTLSIIAFTMVLNAVVAELADALA